MSQPQKQLLHVRSAVIGAQLASIAMRGNSIPPDTAENMIVAQMAQHQLVRFDGDLAQCGASPSNKADIRRAYALKMVEILLLKAGESSLLSDADMEAIVRRGWRMAQVMEEEDQVGSQLSTIRPTAE